MANDIFQVNLRLWLAFIIVNVTGTLIHEIKQRRQISLQLCIEFKRIN